MITFINKLFGRGVEFEYSVIYTDKKGRADLIFEMDNIKKWCNDNLRFGSYKFRAEYSNGRKYEAVIFYNKQDATLFSLRFGK